VATITERAIREMCQAANLAVLDIRFNGHVKVRVKAQDGREGIQVFSKTASDGRTRKNQEADLRRFARGGA
jgi:hypothetical protein